MNPNLLNIIYETLLYYLVGQFSPRTQKMHTKSIKLILV